MKNRVYPIMIMFYVMCFLNSSCKSDDIINPDIELVSGELINMGDVPAGSTGVIPISVEGVALSLPIFLSTSTENFSLDKEIFPAANIVNTANITFAPKFTTPQEEVLATIQLSSGDIVKTVQVVANVIEPEQAAPGTVVYYNNMEFGLNHEAPFNSNNLDDSAIFSENVIVSHTLTHANDVLRNTRTNKTTSRCEDNTTGDCGNAMRFVGQGTSINFSLSGLDPDRNYEVSYHVRPDGSSDRSMDVTVTGDANPAFEDWGGLSDRSFYREVIRLGKSDSAGNLEVKFQYSFSNSFRSISIDDLKIIAD